MKFLSVTLFCTLYALFNVAGATIIKKELPLHPLNSAMDYFTFLFRFKVIIAFSVILISALLMFKALSLGKFSIINPIANGINFVLTIAVGMLYFKDKITLYHLLGIFLILVGIIIISQAEKAQ